MARGNRTGPRGEGPRTGRGVGYCSGSDTPGYTKRPGMGMGGGLRAGGGRGLGFGRGRGFGPGFYQPTPAQRQMTQEGEKQVLERDLEALENQKKVIEERLKQLK